MMTKEEAYQEACRMYPNMSEEGKWTQASVILNGGIIIDENPDVKPTEDLLRLVLEKAKEWLYEKLPDIFAKVAGFFNDLIESLPQWAKNGLQQIFKFIVNYFNS